MRKYLLLISILGLLMIPFVYAQDDPPPDPALVEISGLNPQNFPALEMLASIRDVNNIPIQGLTADDVTLTVNGEAVEITSMENITADDLPISVVLVIDSSESMMGQPMERTKAAAIAFLDTLAPGDEVAVVDFDTTVRVAQDYTTDMDAVRTAIENLEALGRTALYDAAYIGAEVANRANNERRFVIFLTDGNEYGGASSNPPEAGITLASENGIQFYTIGLGYSVDARYLTRMADDTFGQVYLEPSPENLAEIYQYLGGYLRNQYVIQFESGLEPNGEESEFGLTVGEESGFISLVAPDLYPQITVTGLPEGDTAALNAAAAVTVTVDAPRGLGEQSITLNGEAVAGEAQTSENTATTTFNLDPYTLDPGTAELIISATDAEGGTRERTFAFTVEALPPVFTITGLNEGDLINAPTVEVAVEVAQIQGSVDSVTYSIDGAPVATSGIQAPYAAEIDLLAAGPGEHTLTVDVSTGMQAASQTVNFSVDPALFVTPSPTPTNTPTPTDTPTPTLTPTDTPSPTATATHTPSPTDTPEPTATETAAPTDTEAPTEVAQIVPSNTPRPTNTTRPTRTAVPTDTPAPTETETPEPTATETPEPTATDTPAPTETNTPRPTATDTETPEPTATATDEPTRTPRPSNTPRPTATETDAPTNTPTVTAIPASNTPQPTPTSAPVQDVRVEGEDEGDDLSLLLPLGGGLLLLLLLIAIFVISRNRQQRQV